MGLHPAEISSPVFIVFGGGKKKTAERATSIFQLLSPSLHHLYAHNIREYDCRFPWAFDI